MSIKKRFWEKVAIKSPEECWPWKACVDPKTGYGMFGLKDSDGKWRPKPAHRIAWELTNGEIPAKMEIDHNCHNLDAQCPGGRCDHRRCVNPAHLRVVTKKVNLLSGKSQPAFYAKRTHCKNGHELTEQNSYRRAGKTWRECRKCRAAMESRRRRKHGAAIGQGKRPHKH